MLKQHRRRYSNQHLRSWLWLFLTILAAFFSILPAHAQTTLTIAHPVDSTGILEDALPDLGERLSEESAGRVGLETVILPAENARESVRLVYEGEAELALLPIGEAIELSDTFAVFEMPFLFNDLGAVDRFIGGAEGRIVLNSLREFGLVGLGLLHQGLRDLVGEGLAADPRSLRGKTLGVDERTGIQPFNALGARSASRPLFAFETPYAAGRIDAVEVTVPTLARSRALQRRGRLFVTDHRYDGWVLVANRGWLRSLSDDGRFRVRDTLRAWLDTRNSLAQERIDEQLTRIRDHVVLDFQDKERWREALAEPLARYEDLIGADIVEAARRANFVTQGEFSFVVREDPRPMDLQPVQRQARRAETALPWEAGANDAFTPVQLFFGTDREHVDEDGDLTFTGDRARELKLGSVIVTVPKTHDLGEIERPASYLFGLITFSERDDKHIVMRAPALLSRDEFAADLREIVNRSEGRKQAFVFVHGFNVTFDQAAWRTAQIAYDLEFDGAATFYSWPSAGKIDQYVYDQDSARQARDTLQEFLGLVRSESGAEIVHLIGHSMGTNPLMEAVARMWDRGRDVEQGPLFNQVILAAADIDRDVFFDLAKQVNGAADAFTLYASKKDVALKASGLVHGGVPRIGHVPKDGSPVVREPVDTIDATLLNTNFFALGHSDYAEHAELMTDIGKLFLDGTRPPDARTENMTPMPGDGELPYWVYQP